MPSHKRWMCDCSKFCLSQSSHHQPPLAQNDQKTCSYGAWWGFNRDLRERVPDFLGEKKVVVHFTQQYLYENNSQSAMYKHYKLNIIRFDSTIVPRGPASFVAEVLVQKTIVGLLMCHHSNADQNISSLLTNASIAWHALLWCIGQPPASVGIQSV